MDKWTRLREFGTRLKSRWYVALFMLTYKLGEHRVLASVNDLVDEERGAFITLFLGLKDWLPWVTWLLIPVVVLWVVVKLARQPTVGMSGRLTNVVIPAGSDTSPVQTTQMSSPPVTPSDATLAPTQEQIAERLSFVQRLLAVTDQLVKNVHYNINGSIAHCFNKFCEEPEIRTFGQQDVMAGTTIRLLYERYQALTTSALKFQEDAGELTASNLSNESLVRECIKTTQLVNEYRHMVDEFMKFMEMMPTARFWEKAPWSVTVNKNLADDYDEFMRLVKDLRTATPRSFQSHLPTDDRLTTFPRRALWA